MNVSDLCLFNGTRSISKCNYGISWSLVYWMLLKGCWFFFFTDYQCVFSSFAIMSLKKKELAALHDLYSCFRVGVCCGDSSS